MEMEQIKLITDIAVNFERLTKNIYTRLIDIESKQNN